MPGYRCTQKLDKMGIRGSDTGEPAFEDCDVPDENLMGPGGGGAGRLAPWPDMRLLREAKFYVMRADADAIRRPGRELAGA